MWGGRVVHDAIEMVLHAFAEGRDLPVEPFIADVVERMRGEWRSSKAGRYRESPKTVALFEHEYAIDLKPEVWQALSRNVAVCRHEPPPTSRADTATFRAVRPPRSSRASRRSTRTESARASVS